MKIITYEEWYELDYNQKQLEKIEKAYATLNDDGLLDIHFIEEEFIEDCMRTKYQIQIDEYLGGSL